MTILFQERQHFRQIWLWAILVITAAPIVFGIAMTREWKGLAIVLLIEGAIMALFWLAHLDVTVNERGIVVRFVPFHWKPRTIDAGEIAAAERRKYSPIGEYGGWGIRSGGVGDWAYNVSGDEGVQLVLRSGKRILIGSQRSGELEAAIRRVSGKDSGVPVTP